jgi:predicted nucleotidyltransferase
MYTPAQSITSTLTLKQVIDRLSVHSTVDGVILVGSAGSGKLTPDSDYDILIVLSEMPVPLHVGITYIDHRLTDLLFTTSEEVERVVTELEPLNIARWLQTGEIVYDRTGRLKEVKGILLNTDLAVPLSEFERYNLGFGLNFDYLQNRRKVDSEDPACQTSLDLRYCFTLNHLFWWYFSLRCILWEGEKKAIQYLEMHDPEFLKLVRQCLGETDRKAKFQLLEKMAVIVTTPDGGLWTGEPTAILVKDHKDPKQEDIEKASSFWEQLITGPSTANISNQ